jgi:hypothetical protein
MPRYKVAHRYRSGSFGPWEAGDEVTLDSEEAAGHVNRDSPGTLEKIDPEAAAAEKRAKFEADQAEREKERAAKAPTKEPPKGQQRGSQSGR